MVGYFIKKNRYMNTRIIILSLIVLASCKPTEDITTKTKTDIVDKGSSVIDTTKTKVSVEATKVDTTKTTSGETTVIKNIYVVGKDSAGNDIPILKSQDITTTKTSKSTNGIFSKEKKDSTTIHGKDSTNNNLNISTKSKEDIHREVEIGFSWWPYILGAFSAIVLLFLIKKYLPLVRIFLGI